LHLLTLREEGLMRHGLLSAGAFLLTGFSFTFAQTQDKPKENQAASDAGKPGERKNPVKSSPGGLDASKKMYTYACAMCHGAARDGEGDAAASMNLTMKDWHDPAVLSALSDAEIFDLIAKGKDKMPGEGDRLKTEQTWNMVHYVRSLAKKEGAEKPAADAPKS